MGYRLETAELYTLIRPMKIRRTGAPAPTTAVDNVVASITPDDMQIRLLDYDEVRTRLGIMNYILEEVTIDGNKTWKYTALNFSGIVTNYDPGTDLAAATTVHFDYWTPNASKLGLKLVNTTGPVDAEKESIVFKENLTKGGWVPCRYFN